MNGHIYTHHPCLTMLLHDAHLFLNTLNPRCHGVLVRQIHLLKAAQQLQVADVVGVGLAAGSDHGGGLQEMFPGAVVTQPRNADDVLNTCVSKLRTICMCI